jgi:hypothetical protein
MATGIGSTLRDARMRARIDISEVETRTKIRAKYLRAIENEEWDLLPGPVYVKSFLKTYGEYLGLDSRMLIDDYKRRYERMGESEIRPISTLTRERERVARGPVLPSWAVVTGVLAAVVVLLYLIGTGTGSPQHHDVVGPNPKPKHPIGSTGRRHHGRRRTHAAAKKVKLQLTPTARVYVCVANGLGHVLISGVTYDPGVAVPVVSAEKLLVTLGNASVDVKVNGRLLTLQPSSTALNFELTPKGERAIPTGPSCG